MSKFVCSCSNVIDLVKSPAPEEFTLLPTLIMYDALELMKFQKLEKNIDTFLDYIDDNGANNVIRCDECSRIWIYSVNKKKYESYLKE